MKKNQNGFGIVEAVVIFIIIGLISVGGWHIYRSKHSASNTKPGSSAGESPNSNQLATLTGSVTKGPTSPVCRIDEPCSAAVANHTIEALDANKVVAGTTKTDSDGKYTLRLKPGHYTLNLIPKLGLGVIKNNEVDIVSGSNSFNLEADTGIR